MEKFKEQLKEIFRFIIVGGLATIVDFLFYQLFFYLLAKNLTQYEYNFLSIKSNLNTTISTAAGFLAGNIINYILSILYVYKGAKEDKSVQNFKTFAIFTLIGIVGLFTKIILQNIGYNISLKYIFDSAFINWLINTFVYCISTLIVLIINYAGRKIFIFNNKKKSIH